MRNDGQLLFNQSAVEDESINDAPHATSMIYWIVVAFDESKPRSIDGTRLLIGCSFVPFDRLDWVFGDRRTERDDSDVCFVLLFEKLRAKLATFLYCLFVFSKLDQKRRRPDRLLKDTPTRRRRRSQRRRCRRRL